MKCMRNTAEYTWTDHTTNTEIAKELNITPLFLQNTGIQKTLVATYKQDSPK
jgi:hypothetical protein